MANTKKKAELAAEQKLAAALVPEEERPYPVPGNWHWLRGKAILKGMKSTSPKGATFRYVDIDSIDNKRQVVSNPKMLPTEKAPSRASRLLGTGDTLFSMVRPYLRNIAYIDDGLSDCIGSTGFYVCKPASCLAPRYLYHLMRSDYVVMGLSSFMKGDNSPSIRKGDIDSFPFPLPPLPEQERIVTRVESLFSKLDEAESRLKKALEQSETRRAAILNAAFTGALTAGWRANHGLSKKSWKCQRFGDVAVIRSNLVNPGDYQEMPHIAPDNIEKKTGRLLEFRTVAEDGVTSGKHRFYPGQILYSKIRPYLSKAVIVDFDGLCSADMYPVEARGDTRFLWYYILSDEFLAQTFDAGSRTVLPKINQRGLSAIQVPVPTLPEQHEIACRLDDIFASEDAAMDKVRAVLASTAILRQTILAKALRGELGTNDPEEESALESALELDGLSR